MFEQRLNERGAALFPLVMQEVVLKIIKRPEEFDTLISKSFDLGACPFLKDAKEGLDRGAVLFFLFVGKTLAHSSWVSLDNYAAFLDPVFQKLRFEGTGYIGPCYTGPLYRGKGFYPYVLSRICEFLKENGKRRVLICTKTTNHPSIRGITKGGFVLIAEVLSVKLLLWRFCRVVKNENQI